MNWQVISTLVQKDLKLALKQRLVVLPLVLLPIILLVVMPAILTGTFLSLPAEELGDSDLDPFFAAMPPDIAASVEAVGGPREQLVFVFLAFIFAPMFLILPVMSSSVIAADSFAGEKERKTLEAVLYTPTSDIELFGGKLLASWLPGLVVTIVGAGFYWASINVMTTLLGGFQLWPTAMWAVLVFWLAPAAAAVGVSATVLVSSRVTTTQEAYQGGGFLVLPIVALMFGQMSGVMFLSPLVVAIVGLIVWVVAGILLFIGVGTFQRQEMMAKL